MWESGLDAVMVCLSCLMFAQAPAVGDYTKLTKGDYIMRFQIPYWLRKNKSAV
jgi:hypothetical protein